MSRRQPEFELLMSHAASAMKVLAEGIDTALRIQRDEHYDATPDAASHLRQQIETARTLLITKPSTGLDPEANDVWTREHHHDLRTGEA